MAAPGEDFLDFLHFFLPSLPYVLLWFAVCILAGVFWRRHPMPSLMVMLGAILNLLSWTVLNLLQFWMPDLAGGDFGELLAWLRSGLEVVGMVLIIIAVYGWRNPQPRSPYE